MINSRLLSYSIGASVLFGSGVALGGTVRAISKPKSMVAVDLEDGETMAKGSSVCFYAGSKKIDCGKVVKVKGTVAIVKVDDKKSLKKIKKGMAARAGEGDADDGGGMGGGKGGGKGDGDEAKADVSDQATKKKSPFRIWVLYDAALATPSAFNGVSYLAPASTPPSTLWQKGKATSSALFGFAGEVGIPVGAKAIDIGLRYRKFTPTVVDTDYSLQSAEPYASTEVSATAMGLWADYQYMRKAFSPSLALNLTAGLDIDINTVTVAATKLTDGSGASSPIVTATGKMTLASLRFGATFDLLVFKPFGITAGLNVLLPLTAISNSFSASFASGEDQGLADPAGDLKTALGLRKNSLAFDVVIGSVLAF